MKRPATSSIVVFVVILLVTAVIVAAVGMGTDGATAITVGDQTMSAKAVNDELRAVAENEEFVSAVGEQNVTRSPGSIDGSGSANLVTLMVYDLMFAQALDRAGERVTAEDRASAADLRGQAFTSSYSEFPRWFRERFDRRLAIIAAAQRVAGGDRAFERFVKRAARRTDVTVDPAYGRWSDVRAAVLPYPTPFTPTQG
jgi:hypothetical protein